MYYGNIKKNDIAKIGTGKFFVQKVRNFEHYKGRNWKIQKIKKSKK